MIRKKLRTALMAASLLLCITSLVRAQESEMDSLLSVVETTEIDSVKIDALLLISTKLVFNSPDSATHFIDRAYELSQQASYEKGIAKSLNNYGLKNLISGDNLEALEYFQEAEKAYTALNNKHGMALCMHNIAIIYHELQEPEKAIEQYSRAYKLARQVDNHRLHGFGLFNIASNYSELEQYDQAMSYLDSLSALEREVGPITPSYDLRAFIFENQQILDSAEVYYNLAIEEGLEMQNLHNETSLRLSLANVLRNLGKYQLARAQLDTVLKVARENSFEQYESKYYLNAALLAAAQKDFRSAFEYNKKHVYLSDSLMKVNNAEEINELNAKYQTAQKDKQLAEDRHSFAVMEAKKENSILMTIAITIVLVLIVALMFSFKQKRTNQKLAEQNNEKRKQQRNIMESIRYAKKIQKSIMPSISQVKSLAPNAFIYFKPKDIVSGDFYWFGKVGNKTVTSAIDCTGHGVPGAFMSIIAHNKLRRLLNEKCISDPGSILDNLHGEIVTSLNQESGEDSAQDGMDMSICVIDHEEKTISFAGAQNSVMLIRDGLLEEFKPNRISIGGRYSKPRSFTTHKIPFKTGDRLYLYSDGYYDQFGGEENLKLNKKRFKDLLTEVSKESPDQARERLHSYFNEWKGANKQLDDVLVIGTEL